MDGKWGNIITRINFIVGVPCNCELDFSTYFFFSQCRVTDLPEHWPNGDWVIVASKINPNKM